MNDKYYRSEENLKKDQLERHTFYLDPYFSENKVYQTNYIIMNAYWISPKTLYATIGANNEKVSPRQKKKREAERIL